ncbi:MAG: PEP-CTERM sorting domain-containing protein [Phycisphaerales bacterium JB037]
MKTPAALSIALLMAAPAFAGIVSTTGQITQIPPPPLATQGPLYSLHAWTWNERTNISLSGMPIDMSTNPSHSSSPVSGNYTGLVDSHFVHFDSITLTTVTGSVSFSTPIIGVQFRDHVLDLSDAPATTGTLYPTTFVERGWHDFSGSDFLDVNGSTLTFQMTASRFPYFHQVRVFTVATPAPGSLALLGLGGLAAIRRRKR